MFYQACREALRMVWTRCCSSSSCGQIAVSASHTAYKVAVGLQKKLLISQEFSDVPEVGLEPTRGKPSPDFESDKECAMVR